MGINYKAPICCSSTGLTPFCSVVLSKCDRATISSAPHGSVQGGNAAVSWVPWSETHFPAPHSAKSKPGGCLPTNPDSQNQGNCPRLAFARVFRDQKEFGKRRREIRISLSKTLKIWRYKNGKGKPILPVLFPADNLVTSWQCSEGHIFPKQ